MRSALLLVLVIIFTFVKKEAIRGMRWLQKLLIISPIFPMLAIQAGWFTAEFGRQPWVVYPSTTGPDGVSLLTSNAASALTAPELIITIVLFCAVYLLLFVAWIRLTGKFVKEGPDRLPNEPADGVNVMPVFVSRLTGEKPEGKAAGADRDANLKGGE